MGTVLLALAVGSIAGLLSASRFIARFGARIAVLLGFMGMIGGLLVLAAGATVPSEPTVMAGLGLFGIGSGLTDVGLNVEGGALERAMGRTLLPALHASFSAGTLLGAGAGAAAAAARVPVLLHLTVVVVLCSGIVAATIRLLPSDTGKVSDRVCADVGWALTRPHWLDLRLCGIGIVVLGMAFAEGAANDWLPLIMVDGYAMDPGTAALAYSAFVAAMMLARLVGGVVVDRFGRVPTLRCTVVLGVIGLALVVADIGPIVATTGAVLWAVGAALGFPVGLSAAADHSIDATARVSAVATIGYFAFLVGPPLLGALGHEFGLVKAMAGVLVGLVLAALFIPATRERSET